MNILKAFLLPVFLMGWFCHAADGQSLLVAGDTIKQLSVTATPLQFRTDTLRIETISPKESTISWWIGSNTPWVIALLVSFIGIWVNVYINKRQMKSVLSTNNRQQWINELRSTAAEFLTQAKLLNSEYQSKHHSPEREMAIQEKLWLSRTKLHLLLSLAKPDHKKMIDSIENLAIILDKHLLNNRAASRNQTIGFDNQKFVTQLNEVTEISQALLYAEWGKIQKAV